MMPPRQPSRRDTKTVFVVDDDDGVRKSLAYLLRGEGYTVVSSSCGNEALKQCDPAAPGCFLLDIHLPDMDGVELRRQLVARGCRQPYVVLSGHADVSLAIEALQGGALDFLQKPFDSVRLLQRIDAAMHLDARQRETQEAIDSLTERERQLLHLIAEGKLSKEIAKLLGISPRTVEVHRRNIMHKMGADSIARLVRMLTEYASPPSGLTGHG